MLAVSQSAPSQMLDKILSMVLNIPGFWIAHDSEYVSGSECARVLDRVLNMLLILYMPGFCIYQSSEYAGVTQGSEYPSIIPEYAWISLIMSEYAWVCVNMPKLRAVKVFTKKFSHICKIVQSHSIVQLPVVWHRYWLSVNISYSKTKTMPGCYFNK